MSPEPPAKRPRKGTKSCVECRQRKTRCVWPSEDSETCQSCMARGRTCELQVQMLPTSRAIAVTSRARLGRLESEVASLSLTVRHLQAQLGSRLPATPSPAHLQQSSRLETESDRPDSHSDRDDGHDDDDNDESDSSASDSSPAHPPAHLLPLFHNGLLDADGNGSLPLPLDAPTPHKMGKSSALRGLMPSREEMLAITSYASSWLSLYNTLSPLISFTKTGEEMLLQYDRLQPDPNSDPIALAALLISIAITVQQTPDDTTSHATIPIRDVPTYIKDVSDTVERIVISDDTLAGSLEGIEATLLFLRLQLGRAKVRKTLLLSRRVIALAELRGLPRASMALATHQDSPTESSRDSQAGAPSASAVLWSRKVEVWESICAVDRILSMMWSMPLATANYPLAKRPVVDIQGQVNPQSYLYSLADIASRVLELDNMYSSGRPILDLFNAVISTDQELRSLASLTPQTWRKVHGPQLSIDALLQYWHQYLTVRTHLQLALKYRESQQFAFNFVTCLDACQELARRYVSMRAILPAGFFANQMLDLQAFTATVFLLLASYQTTSSDTGALTQAADVNITSGIIDQAVRMMGFAANGAGADFARQAADAIRSLRSLLQQPQPSQSSQKITLSLPLVGRIHVSRKSHVSHPTFPEQSYAASDQQPQRLWPNTASESSSGSAFVPPQPDMLFGPSDLSTMDSLTYLMEIPDNDPFLNDDALGTEQLFTYT